MLGQPAPPRGAGFERDDAPLGRRSGGRAGAARFAGPLAQDSAGPASRLPAPDVESAVRPPAEPRGPPGGGRRVPGRPPPRGWTLRRRRRGAGRRATSFNPPVCESEPRAQHATAPTKRYAARALAVGV